ncbi:MAG: murein L,D-transpeptidase catalytic domain family protein [Bacteroidetes bacterium]|nr:murein L,D-transpeptidase catalytic domain family protein [Bacteroidota bacterium]
MKTVLTTINKAGLCMAFLVAPVIAGSGKTSNLPSVTSTVKTTTNTVNTEANKIVALYDAMKLKRYGLNKSAFEYALKGYQHLLSGRKLRHSSVLSICDFSLSSRRKRLFIIDVEQQKLLINTYVAHGRKSGAEYARSFSNSPESHMSSLGFYVTRNTYYGDHGLALKIEGLEKGFNDNASGRNIVVHGSEYVGADYLRYNRMNGRSFGCPAVPAEQTSKVINTIKGGSCLFIYYPTKQYLTKSKILNE